MAHILSKRFPEDVVRKIASNVSDLNIHDRLTSIHRYPGRGHSTWRGVHEEMMWRDTHRYSCTYHFCEISSCNCYHRFPGFLLRRVDSGAWLPGLGESRAAERLEYPTQQAGLLEQDFAPTPAVWIDFEAQEMGTMESMTPIVYAGGEPDIQGWTGDDELNMYMALVSSEPPFSQ